MIPKELKKKLIKKNGISLSEYIDFCLYDKNVGYYENISRIGDDFITSPEVSQLFGECISVFFLYLSNLNSFQDLNRIAEFGPGNGTLISDIIRSLKSYNKFKRINISLFEKSENLIKNQKKNLGNLINPNIEITWLNKIESLEKNSYFMVCNELFDAFPINQYISRNNKLFERRVVYKNKNILFEEYPTSWKLLNKKKKLKDGDIIEHSCKMEKFISKIFNHLKLYGGVFLLFDYGPYQKANISTVQAIFKKKKCNLFEYPSRADITHHINFERLKEISKGYNLFSIGPIPQSKFLNMFGINERLDNILTGLSSIKIKKKLEGEFFKLTSQTEMGELFKCMIFTNEQIKLSI